eukprot:8439-Amphidinium_carterae.1
MCAVAKARVIATSLRRAAICTPAVLQYCKCWPPEHISGALCTTCILSWLIHSHSISLAQTVGQVASQLEALIPGFSCLSCWKKVIKMFEGCLQKVLWTIGTALLWRFQHMFSFSLPMLSTSVLTDGTRRQLQAAMRHCSQPSSCKVSHRIPNTFGDRGGG